MAEHSKYYYDYNRNDLDRPDPFKDSSQDFWEEDGISLTGNPGTASGDMITFDLTMEPDKIDLNLDQPFCRSNAIKYLSRFGKKNGKSKQDILKAIHYCILLYHFSGLHNEIKGTYETF